MDKIQELKNKIAIYNIVKNHFGYTEESLKLFKYRLFYEPLICPEYKDIIGNAPDLRRRIKVENVQELQNSDIGWKKFETYFYNFCASTFITYIDYRNNKVIYKGQETKLKKALEDYYFNSSSRIIYNDFNRIISDKKIIAEAIQQRLDEVGAYKLPKSNMLELVISLNFADWLLCSTAESWTSCVSLESEYSPTHWCQIPSFIGDSNRAMVYLTDGEKKTYQGITTDKFKSRSWMLLVKTKNSKEGKIGYSMVSEHPNYSKILHNLIKENLGLNMLQEKSFTSKYKIELLWHDIGNGKRFLGYNYFDSTEVHILKKKPLGSYGFFDTKQKGYKTHIISNKKVFHGNYSGFRYSAGLKELMKNKNSIIMSYGEEYVTPDEDIFEEII
jgi:hypothetical protein